MPGQIYKATPIGESPWKRHVPIVGARRSGLLAARFLAFIADEHFPCVGAKAASARGARRTAEFGMLGDPSSDRSLLEELTDFTAMLDGGDYPESTVDCTWRTTGNVLMTSPERIPAVRLERWSSMRAIRWS